MPKVTHKAFKYIKDKEGIFEYRHKKNGLTVLIKEDHSTPTATLNVTYHVGSRNEAAGYTGATHILEHLMFKGSKRFNKEKGNPFWLLMEARGAKLNATTWLDRTNYYELLPCEHIPQAIALEADRMRHAFIREEDRAREMTIVRNEYERSENNPRAALEKEVWATAFQAHPYHHPTIGWRSDIENFSIERLQRFYDEFYWPNNSTVVVIGDIDTKNILGVIDKEFGRHSASKKAIPEVHTTEPPQEGKRTVELRRAGEVGVVNVAHKIGPALSKDTHALQVLGKILVDGKGSRLYKALVERGLASEVEVWPYPFADGGLFESVAVLSPKTKHNDVEKIVVNEYARIAVKGVTEDELHRAKMKIKTEETFLRDGSYAIASSLNEAISLGNWTFFTDYLKKIDKVTTADIQNVVRRYFVEDQSTIGYFIPKVN